VGRRWGAREDAEGDGGERIVDRDGGAGLARPETLDLMRNEPEPGSTCTEGDESLLGTLFVSLRGKGVAGVDVTSPGGSTGEESTEEMLPCRE
jgi:hypothetical protein